VITNGALAGTRGSRSAKSGPISDNQNTELRTPLVTLSGSEILSFSCYVSSETSFDGLKVWVYDEDGDFRDVLEGVEGSPLLSGNPPLGNAIHYPGRSP